MLTNRVPQQPAARRGFTLLELLIVITVIIALLALLIPAVGTVMTTTRNAGVQTEIRDLETKIADFRATFKVQEPFPSRLILHENSANWSNTDTLTRETKAYFKSLWPNLDWANLPATIDFNNDGTTESLKLNGAECLVFFLGGMVDKTTTGSQTIYQCVGFSKNSGNPFSKTGANRVGPFLEFQSSRLTDKNDNKMLEYMDSLPGQSAPFLYIYGNEGRGYPVYDSSNPDSNLDLQVGTTRDLKRPYFQAQSSTKTTWWKSKEFQIISPGSDGEYGVGGLYNPENADGDLNASDPYPSSPAPNYNNRQMERDNITNFKSGTLGS